MSITRPVRLGLRAGVTQNISTSGVFFETDVDYAQGSEIVFAIELEGLTKKKLTLRCRGKIVRVERRAGKLGLAVNIVASEPRVGICNEPQLIQ